ncbi:MAG: electron transfer flavoprotein subunit beta/FixA family protein [Fidelibacterota bacterium]
MELKLLVLAKQVPDTHNITAEAMKADGTVNRGALPAIFNPEDLNALEMALELNERFGGAVTVMTMGPPRAANILREALYYGAKHVILITDRAFAGADTLATSYTLALAIKKLGKFDLILCGRQAIDGDTAQIGPQVAEKIGFNQITFVDQIHDIKNGRITLSRNLGRSAEKIRTPLPLLITVPASANQPRSYGAKRIAKYKKARTRQELRKELLKTNPDSDEKTIDQEAQKLKQKSLLIETWSAADLEADPNLIGLAGSPTKVNKVSNVVFAASQAKNVEPNEKGIQDLMKELMEEHTFG